MTGDLHDRPEYFRGFAVYSNETVTLDDQERGDDFREQKWLRSDSPVIPRFPCSENLFSTRNPGFRIISKGEIVSNRSSEIEREHGTNKSGGQVTGSNGIIIFVVRPASPRPIDLELYLRSRYRRDVPLQQALYFFPSFSVAFFFLTLLVRPLLFSLRHLACFLSPDNAAFLRTGEPSPVESSHRTHAIR